MTDKEKAILTLSKKEIDNIFLDYLYSSKNLFIARSIILLICLYIYFFQNHASYLIFASGILIGSFAQDLAWISTLSKSWPFSKSIMDWEKVKEIAESK